MQTQTQAATAVQTAAQQHNEPSWLINKRLAALDQMADLPMPLVQRFNYRDWELMPGNLQWADSKRDLAQVADGPVQIVQVGQTTVRVNLPEKLQEQGVVLTDFFTAVKDYPDLVQEAFMTKAMKANENRLASYHTAYLNAGVFLYVPNNVVISEPIDIQLIQDNTLDQPLNSHVLVVAGRNTEVSVSQHLTTVGENANLANCLMEVIADENSHVTVATLDELGRKTMAYVERRAYAADNASVNWAVGFMNEGNTIGNFDTELNGVGSRADAKVIAITDHDQRMGVNTKITNRGKHTNGNILQRGVILEDSELVYNGIGDIIHGAAGSEAEQENRLLMMSSNAHGNANPILLIDENDVMAGHAASVGQVDEQQLYYLMSRGIRRETAERLVIRGFLGAVLSAIPAKAVRSQLVDIIERKLENGR
ncbi:Fe-S cluster assembly protein SufD [Levilactobacillus wangkuiensis]|uniref:Fe-S cluster assembly protein SufD n=1 Tax=Levilactobacillus wangkuiensis TaxID=2799566 RepID=UPI00194265E8|nr:Fe-S cluster assembly protein SufD [Levilactobacillus wangkuiensis]